MKARRALTGGTAAGAGLSATTFGAGAAGGLYRRSRIVIVVIRLLAGRASHRLPSLQHRWTRIVRIMRRSRTNHNCGRRRGSSLGLQLIVRVNRLRSLGVDFDIHRLKLSVFILRDFHIHAVALLQLLRLNRLVRDLDGQDSRVLSLQIEGLRFHHANHTLECLGGNRRIRSPIALLAAPRNLRALMAGDTGWIRARRIRSRNRLPHLRHQRRSSHAKNRNALLNLPLRRQSPQGSGNQKPANQKPR